MDTKRPNDELLSAYLDGQLNVAEKAEVERWLNSSDEARQLLDDLRGVSASLKELPRHQLDDDFASSVLRRAEDAILTGQPHELRPSPAESVWWSLARRIVQPRPLSYLAATICIATVVWIMDSGRRPAAPPVVAVVPDRASAPSAALAPAEPPTVRAAPESLASKRDAAGEPQADESARRLKARADGSDAKPEGRVSGGFAQDGLNTAERSRAVQAPAMESLGDLSTDSRRLAEQKKAGDADHNWRAEPAKAMAAPTNQPAAPMLAPAAPVAATPAPRPSAEAAAGDAPPAEHMAKSYKMKRAGPAADSEAESIASHSLKGGGQPLTAKSAAAPPARQGEVARQEESTPKMVLVVKVSDEALRRNAFRTLLAEQTSSFGGLAGQRLSAASSSVDRKAADKDNDKQQAPAKPGAPADELAAAPRDAAGMNGQQQLRFDSTVVEANLTPIQLRLLTDSLRRRPEWFAVSDPNWTELTLDPFAERKEQAGVTVVQQALPSGPQGNRDFSNLSQSSAKAAEPVGQKQEQPSSAAVASQIRGAPQAKQAQQALSNSALIVGETDTGIMNQTITAEAQAGQEPGGRGVTISGQSGSNFFGAQPAQQPASMSDPISGQSGTNGIYGTQSQQAASRSDTIRVRFLLQPLEVTAAPNAAEAKPAEAGIPAAKP